VTIFLFNFMDIKEFDWRKEEMDMLEKIRKHTDAWQRELSV